MSSLEQLQQRIAELEFLAYRSAHDLKGPLVTIAHFLKGLPASAKAGRWDEFDADVARMSRVLDQSRRMLDDLLQLARLEQPSNPPRPLSISRLVRTASEQIEAAILPQQLLIDLVGDGPMVIGHESQLVAVFQNLFENAAKFDAGESSLVDIEIHCHCDGPQVTIRVRDFGVGIPETERSRVFEPFVRLHRRRPGTGLGLCIVQRAVERHNGRVWIESPTNGPGTVVCFTLPTSDQPADFFGKATE